MWYQKKPEKFPHISNSMLFSVPHENIGPLLSKCKLFIDSHGSTSHSHTNLQERGQRTSVADLRGGGGLGGLNPPPLGLPSKNLMCIEKRHHNISRPTLCSYSTLSQAQPQTIGFKPPPPPPLGLPSEHVTLSWTAFYGLHCVSRCQENITYGG